VQELQLPHIRLFSLLPELWTRSANSECFSRYEQKAKDAFGFLVRESPENGYAFTSAPLGIVSNRPKTRGSLLLIHNDIRRNAP